MAELIVYASATSPGCWVARCSLCPEGWASLPRPFEHQAKFAGAAHMARSHAGQWSGEVA